MRILLQSSCSVLLAVVTCCHGGAAESNRWPGVRVQYFEGVNFEKQVLETYEPHMRFDCWVPMPYRGIPDLFGPYSIRWTSELTIEETGLYRLAPTRMGGVTLRILLDGKPVSYRKVQKEIPDKRGRRKLHEVIEGRSQMLKRGTIPITLELSNPGAIFVDEPIALTLQQLGKDPKELPSSLLQVAPWEGMRRRGILLFTMIGHSNVTQVFHRGGWQGKGTKSWSWNGDSRCWMITGTKFGVEKPSDALVDALSQKYPDVGFGGIDLGVNGSGAHEWGAGDMSYRHALEVLSASQAYGPLFAIGAHFDWEEMKQMKFAAAYADDLTDLIVRFRESLAQEKLPWLVTRITPAKEWMNGKQRPLYEKVYTGLSKVTNALPYVAAIDCDDFSEPEELTWKQPWHYMPLGHAKWVERALLQLSRLRAIERGTEICNRDLLSPGETERRTGMFEGELVLEGEILRVSKVRTLKQLAPYKDALTVIEYRLLTADPAYKVERFVVITPSIRDKKYLPTTKYKPGDRHRVTLAPWEAQSGATKRLPVDDDIEEFELPLLYGIEFGEFDSRDDGD